jgi:hypothetical protein
MRTTPASEIFRTACGLHGQPWSARAGEDSLSLTDFRMLRPLLSDRLNAAWHVFPWPQLVVMENRRRLEEIFHFDKEYKAGDQVFDAVSNKCWQCVQPTPDNMGNPADLPKYWAQLGALPFQRTNNPAALFQVGDRVFNPGDGGIYYCFAANSYFVDIRNPNRWSILLPFEPAFPLVDDFQTSMEEVFGVWLECPSRIGPSTLDFILDESSVRVEGDPGSAWFRYRPSCPELTGDPWDEESVYSPDQQVYFTDSNGVGDFWVCLVAPALGQAPGSDPLLWERINLPYTFGPYLARALHADWYELDGQADKALVAVTTANERLQLELDKIERQQRQREPWSMATRC